MSYTVHQMLLDSEESYLNTTFWDVQPLFLMVQNGDVESLQNSLHIRLDRFPAGRITRDARKQLDYLAVSLVNTFMIASIQGGVYPPEANAVADQALRRLSMMRNTSDIPDLITEAALCLCGLVTESRRQSTENPHVEKARHFISTHLTQEIRIEDVSRAAGISPYHLCRLFKAHTGMTVKKYLLQERIEAARQLLSTTDRSITQIAALLRFCDQSYFTMVFRRETGRTPGEYRNMKKI